MKNIDERGSNKDEQKTASNEKKVLRQNFNKHFSFNEKFLCQNWNLY